MDRDFSSQFNFDRVVLIFRLPDPSIPYHNHNLLMLEPFFQKVDGQTVDTSEYDYRGKGEGKEKEENERVRWR